MIRPLVGRTHVRYAGGVTLAARPDRDPLGDPRARHGVVAASAAVPARDRAIVVDEPVASLLPEGGLRRGHVVGCDGPAAVSLAFATVAGAVRNGAWLAVVGMPWVGPEAIAELGVPMERIVAVRSGSGAAEWAERVAVAADGFEVIVTHPPPGAERVERRLRQRLQARGVVLVVVGRAVDRLACDLVLTADAPVWVGIGSGTGRLAGRTVELRLSGRRVPRPVTAAVWLPAPDGRMRPVPEPANVPQLERVG